MEAAARQAVQQLKLDAAVCRTGCIGFCAKEPLLDLVLPNGPRVSFAAMTPAKTRDLLAAYASRSDAWPGLALGRFAREEHVATGETHEYPPASGRLGNVPEWSELDFYRRRKRSSCGTAARSIP